jgi:hypothetical protein
VGSNSEKFDAGLRTFGTGTGLAQLDLRSSRGKIALVALAPMPDDGGGNYRPEARAKDEGYYARPVGRVKRRTVDPATSAVVASILRAWYGNLSAAADALAEDRRDLWRWCKGREPMPERVIARMAARREQAEARRKEVVRCRVEKAQLQADVELAKLQEARCELDRLIDATERTGGVFGWSRLGYVTPERAILIRQGDRRRAVHRSHLLRQS